MKTGDIPLPDKEAMDKMRHMCRIFGRPIGVPRHTFRRILFLAGLAPCSPVEDPIWNASIQPLHFEQTGPEKTVFFSGFVVPGSNS